MRYVIYGAGAIGGTIGAQLHEAGHDVALIARGEHLEAMQSSGLTLERPSGEVRRDVPAFASPEEAEVRSGSDIVVLSMKTQDSLDALERLADLCDSSLPIVCAQNGVDSERQALRRFEHVYAMCVVVPAVYREPGVVRAHGVPKLGVLDVGRYPRGRDDTAEAIARDLDTAGFSSRPVQDPMRIKYGKLIVNLHNALDALGDKEARASEFAEMARQEAYRVYEAAGIDVASPEEDRQRRKGNVEERQAINGEPWAGGSSWQSLARATGSIETDYLNGEIVLLGRLHGVPTPVNAAIQREAKRAARERRPAGSMSLEEVAAALAV